MATRRSRWPYVVGALGILLLALWALWKPVVEPMLVKYPTDLEGEAHAEGTIRFLLDPETRAPLDPPEEQELVIDRSLVVDADASDGEVAVVDEIDQQQIGGEPSELRQRYVIDRRTMENVDDERAYAYSEDNVTDRSPAFAINLPLDTGDGPYDVWKNETGQTYEFTGGDTYEVDEVELRLYEGSAEEMEATDAYIAALEPQGVPTELTIDELRPILLAAALDLDALLDALLPNLSPEDVQALLAVASEPVRLSYFISVDTRFGVEPTTGAIVDLQSIRQTLGARPDPDALGNIGAILERYPNVAEAVSALATLNGFATGPPIPVFEYEYAQTPDSVSETVEQANDLGSQVKLAQNTIPLALLIGGVALLAAAIIGFLLRRKGGPDEPQPDLAEPEPEPELGTVPDTEPVDEPVEPAPDRRPVTKPPEEPPP